jgi:hypothetical protein
VRLNRIVRKRLRDADGEVVGDVNAAIAVNVGEAAGSEVHVSSNSRIVQGASGARAQERRSAAPPTEPDERKEDT